MAEYAVILAGGSGTRLWPLSRSRFPKQLLGLGSQESLLQQTARRLMQRVRADHIYIITHEDHVLVVQDQLKTVDEKVVTNVLVEEVARNTLPAIGWVTALIHQKDPQAVIGVFPSDHHIQDLSAFLKCWGQATQIAQQQRIVTFGIQPTHAAIEYGYIKKGSQVLSDDCYAVQEFSEKPPLELAQEYIKTGQYYWNGGMFVFKSQRFLELLKVHSLETYQVIQELAAKKAVMASKNLYQKAPATSIDYGLMEKIDCAAVVVSDFGWNDLGGWKSIHEMLPKTSDNNVEIGSVIQEHCQDSLLWSEGRPIVGYGLQGLAVIEASDTVLVCPLEESGHIRSLVQKVRAHDKELAESVNRENRPWGYFEILNKTKIFKVKRIVVYPQSSLSLQMHYKRVEHWVVIEGKPTIQIGQEKKTYAPNQSVFIPVETKHRLINETDSDVIIIEVQTGSYFGEDDIVRFEDGFGPKG